MKLNLKLTLLSAILCMISTSLVAQYPSKNDLTPIVYKRLLNENKIFKFEVNHLKSELQKTNVSVSKSQQSIDSLLQQNSTGHLSEELAKINDELSSLRQQLANNNAIVIPSVSNGSLSKVEYKEWKKRIKSLTEIQYSTLISENNQLKGIIQSEGEKLKTLEVTKKVNDKHLELLRKLFRNTKRSDDKDVYSEEQ